MADTMFRQFSFIITFGLAILLWSVSSNISMAQDPFYKSYTEEEGLPSNDVYDVLMDDEGYMWFATDNGVSRYDGNTFLNFNTSNGLPTNSVLKLYKDLFGRIWFLAYNGMLSYFEGGKVHAYAYNDSVVEYFSDNYIRKILVDTLGGLLLSPRHGSFGYINSEGLVTTNDDQVPLKVDSCFLSFEERIDDHFMTILRNKPGNCLGTGRLYYLDDKYYLTVPHSGREFHRNYIKKKDGSYLVSYRSCLYHIEGKRVRKIMDFGEEVLSLFIDDHFNLWASIKYDNGIYMFENAEIVEFPVHYFNGYTITDIIQDREGGYWLGVEGQGVFFLPSFDFNLYKLPWDDRNLNVVSLAISGDRMYFSSRDKRLYAGNISDGSISNIRRLQIGEPYDWIKHISIDSDGYLWLSSTEYLRYDPTGFPRPTDTVMNSSFLQGGIGDTVIVASRKLGIYHKDKLVLLTDPDSSRRVYAAYQERNKGIWLGTLYGLYLFSDGKACFKGHISPYLQERISCLDKMSDMLVVGTTAHGILFVRNDTVAFHINNAEGLLGNSVKSIFIQDDKTVWVGTKDGLTRILFHDDHSGYNIESYGNSDGMPSSEINSICMHDDHIWMATGKGLVSFDPDKLQPHIMPPIIRITDVFIGGKDTSLHDHYDLAYDQNDIRISFNGISYRSDEGLRYRYRLINFNDEIVQTKNQWANFPNLLPGKYTFLVNVGNAHGVWNDTPKQISFTIKKHFTQTVWFIILLIIASSATVTLISMFFHRLKKVKENARIDLLRMEQKLFRLQMNPHFVFNALLAIQGYMYMNKPKEAGRYLTSFAKMIRHTLYGSSEEYISLDREIEALQYYLELQKLRFNDHFEFSIILEDDIIPESTLVPPLLLQPFLENAIEHGLQHKKEKGVLKLKMKLEEECLMVEIEDDGIGRAESQKLQNEKGKLHKSMGMDIVGKRLDSLNKILSQKIRLEIVDLKTDDGAAAGTLVRLCIPYRSA